MMLLLAVMLTATITWAQFGGGNVTIYTGTLAADKIEAGHAYIVKWNMPEGYDGNESEYDVTNPVFRAVTISNEDPADQKVVSQDGNVQFLGTYSPVNIYTVSNSNLYMGSDNTLCYPIGKGFKVGAFRAWFQMKTSSKGDVNGDGEISVSDVTAIVNHVLGVANDKFIIENADINGDGNISVSDVTALVNMILTTGNKFSVVVNGADGITFGGAGNGQARVSRK